MRDKNNQSTESIDETAVKVKSILLLCNPSNGPQIFGNTILSTMRIRNLIVELYINKKKTQIKIIFDV